MNILNTVNAILAGFSDFFFFMGVGSAIVLQDSLFPGYSSCLTPQQGLAVQFHLSEPTKA